MILSEKMAEWFLNEKTMKEQEGKISEYSQKKMSRYVYNKLEKKADPSYWPTKGIRK